MSDTVWSEKDIVAMLSLIREQSPPHHFEFHDHFWVLITTIMSHRTKDEVTDAAARALFNRYGTSRHLSQASYEEVLQIIGRVGFRTVKAGRVIGAARIVEEKFGGRVPETMEDLMTIPGVGRKTASVVLADSFGIPAIAVDTHVLRVSNRIGWAHSKNPDGTEDQLKKIIPRDRWVGFNPMIVEFGKKICRPIGPRCETCPVSKWCEYYKNNSVKE